MLRKNLLTLSLVLMATIGLMSFVSARPRPGSQSSAAKNAEFREKNKELKNKIARLGRTIDDDLDYISSNDDQNLNEYDQDSLEDYYWKRGTDNIDKDIGTLLYLGQRRERENPDSWRNARNQKAISKFLEDNPEYININNNN